MGRVEGMVAIVTGAGSGIGRADTILLAAEGATVIATDIDTDGGRVTVDRAGPNAHFVTQDVTDEQGWIDLIADVEARFGRLDILINNAGVVSFATVEDAGLDDFRRMNAVMAEGVFLGCKHAIPAMRRAGGGSIINMASIVTKVGFPIFFAYTAAKGAVEAMSRSIAMHCQETGSGIRCNTIHPGAIETPMMALAEGRPGEERPVAAGALPQGAIGAAEDIAQAVLFLASAESRFITGIELQVDNGWHVRSGGPT
ncbi:SDR family oxidoreductase [Sphingomonas sp. SUN019]|uniref:SDR family oxidoreductase n=1 Tax=Sphingomonas sp. SUN019 TaxID=2937788 RepID=UPI002164C3CD|nr:SDR family oxidoreductase [Sphingomonas sp. SUN019]UVO49714.1 SDR family oxidoreductase [Sphingomonas sp. SUN019]